MFPNLLDNAITFNVPPNENSLLYVHLKFLCHKYGFAINICKSFKELKLNFSIIIQEKTKTCKNLVIYTGNSHFTGSLHEVKEKDIRV